MGSKAKVERGGSGKEILQNDFLERGRKLKKGRSRKGWRVRERNRVGVVVVSSGSGDRVWLMGWPVIGIELGGETQETDFALP
jgi:hypothetical protein